VAEKGKNPRPFMHGEEGNNSVTQVGGRRFMTDFVSPQGFEKCYLI